MANLADQLKALCVIYAAFFAVVLEAVPQFYPVRYEPHHHPQVRRLIRQPQDYLFDDGLNEVTNSLYRDRNGRDYFDKMNVGPETLYVVRSADSDKDYGTGAHLTKKSARKFNPFPISITRQPDPEQTIAEGSFTDEELGRIVRKAITSAKYGELQELSQPTKRLFSRSESMRKPAYQANFIPDAKIDVTPEEKEAERQSLGDFSIEKSFGLDSDASATIGEEIGKVEVQPDHLADVALSETQPEVYQFVNHVTMDEGESGDNDGEEEGGSDDPIEGDVVLSVIEEDDDDGVKENGEERGAESSIVLNTGTAGPASTTEYYETQSADFEVDERPPTTTPGISTTDGTEPETTPMEGY